MFLSSTRRLVVLIVVVVPLTVKLPESVKSVPDTAPENIPPAGIVTVPVNVGEASGATPVKVFEAMLIVLFVRVTDSFPSRDFSL